MTTARDSTMTLSTEEKVKIIIGAVAANGGVAAWAADEIMGLMHEQQVGEGLCIVTQEDGNNYCRILSLLGMEEEGDPVLWVEAHLAARDAVVIDDGDELMCCNGHDCGCQGVTKNKYRAYLVAQDRTAVTDQLMIDLYMAASKGFHTSETCGTDNRYCHVSKFRSFEDLHAFSVAWTQAMLASQEEVK